MVLLVKQVHLQKEVGAGMRERDRQWLLAMGGLRAGR